MLQRPNISGHSVRTKPMMEAGHTWRSTTSLRENRPLSQSSKDVCVGFVLELNRMREKNGFSYALFVSWLEQLFGTASPAPPLESITYGVNSLKSTFTKLRKSSSHPSGQARLNASWNGLSPYLAEARKYTRIAPQGQYHKSKLWRVP